ncbi:MAG: DUF1772 domain-containing protein [Alphaproteobacteria bacterium]|nr:DUF1772 domain-containing protein [Alphaproteobacteria bacterium]
MLKAAWHGSGGAVHTVTLLAMLSLLFSGAMFGFFFAWVCSTMWGLDAADPNVAVAAMQAMNASVRNWVFAPAFFGTPVLLIVTALAALRTGARRAATGFALAGLLYVLGAMVPTMTVNVPLNEALALVETPLGAAEAGDAWRAYSGPWQAWNAVRAAAAGCVLALAGWSLRGAGALPVRRAGG